MRTDGQTAMKVEIVMSIQPYRAFQMNFTFTKSRGLVSIYIWWVIKSWPLYLNKGQSNSDGISDWNRSPSIWSVLCHLIFRAVLHPRHGVDVEINQYLSVKYCRMSKALINWLSLQGKINFKYQWENWEGLNARKFKLLISVQTLGDLHRSFIHSKTG